MKKNRIVRIIALIGVIAIIAGGLLPILSAY